MENILNILNISDISDISEDFLEDFLEEYKTKLIKDGIESCKKDVNMKSYEIEGSVEGFNLCRNLFSFEDFKNVLNERMKKELEFIGSDNSENVEDYWRYHYATIQIRFVYDRIKFMKYF